MHRALKSVVGLREKERNKNTKQLSRPKSSQRRGSIGNQPRLEMHRGLRHGVGLGKKRLLGEITKGSLRGIPLGYLISAGRHQPELTIASGSRTRRWLSIQTIGGALQNSCQARPPGQPASTLLGGHLLSPYLDPAWVYLVGKTVLEGGVITTNRSLTRNESLVTFLSKSPVSTHPSASQIQRRSSISSQAQSCQVHCIQIDRSSTVLSPVILGI